MIDFIYYLISLPFIITTYKIYVCSVFLFQIIITTICALDYEKLKPLSNDEKIFLFFIFLIISFLSIVFIFIIYYTIIVGLIPALVFLIVRLLVLKNSKL